MSGETAPVGLVVAGYGYWGPNIVRNAIERPEFELLALCELDAGKAAVFSRRHPGLPTCRDFELLLDPRVEAVFLATPPATHHALASRALQAGKHVLVEKPLAMTVAEAEDLIAQAEAADRVLMPGHTFLYSPPVNKVRDLMRRRRAGRDLLRDFLADESGAVPGRRSDPRSGAP